MEKQRKKKIIGYQMVGALFIMLLLSWIVPSKAEADVKVLTGITASYKGNDVLRGSYLSMNDVSVIANYSDGTWEVITTFTLSTSLISQTGVNTITAYYGGMFATFKVVGIEPQVITYYNVYFVSNGGSYIAPIINVKKDATILLPEAPTRYGYRFRGWYTTSYLVTQFTEETPIIATMFLYAKWEEKAVISGDTISYNISNGSLSTSITANLSGQKYGPNVDLDVSYIEPLNIEEAVEKIALTNRYIAFEFNMEDYVYSDSTPIPVTITIPTTFNASKCAVYFTTNRKTIMGKMTGKLVGTNAYQFFAYEVGSYILIECENETVVETDPYINAYITIDKLEEALMVDGEAALIVKFHNYAGTESKVDLQWTSSEIDVADVDDNGIVTAYATGITTITVKSLDGKFKATYRLRVVEDNTIASSIKTNVTSKTLYKGKSFQIVTTVSPANADSYVKYSSSKSSIASVSSSGKVTAKKAGRCYIYIKTADGSNITKKVRIIVK